MYLIQTDSIKRHVLCSFYSLPFATLIFFPSECQVPLVRHTFSSFTNAFVELCPILNEVYQPPQFWGKNGHFQTFIYALKGRFRCQPPKNRHRRMARTSDGATVSFDIFEPTAPHLQGFDATICIAPGIGNNSESQYVRSAINLLGKHGYRVAVLNHLGTLSDVELTAPRIYRFNPAFLGATKHLYMRVCPSVGRSVTPSHFQRLRHALEHRVASIGSC